MVNIVGRKQWDAEPPVEWERIDNHPVKTVLLMFTWTQTCNDLASCRKTIKKLQRDQMDEGLPDIQWNFLIGGDGQVYEGRGWETRPTTEVQFYSYRYKTIDIAYISQPYDRVPLVMEYAGNKLIQEGVRQRYIAEEHAIVRQQYPRTFHDD